jgi:hypothetical protein
MKELRVERACGRGVGRGVGRCEALPVCSGAASRARCRGQRESARRALAARLTLHDVHQIDSPLQSMFQTVSPGKRGVRARRRSILRRLIDRLVAPAKQRLQ